VLTTHFLLVSVYEWVGSTLPPSPLCMHRHVMEWLHLYPKRRETVNKISYRTWLRSESNQCAWSTFEEQFTLHSLKPYFIHSFRLYVVVAWIKLTFRKIIPKHMFLTIYTYASHLQIIPNNSLKFYSSFFQTLKSKELSNVPTNVHIILNHKSHW
jgi:hypothetical protein